MSTNCPNNSFKRSLEGTAEDRDEILPPLAGVSRAASAGAV
jgi:hypothetical protein